MRQEVEVFVKITLDVDASKSKKEIKEYIGRVLKPPSRWVKQEIGVQDFEKVKHKIISIKEESEIYKTNEN